MQDAVNHHHIRPGGIIRKLMPHEQPLLQAHLQRLDPEGRRDRFNGVVNDAFLESYAARCFTDGTVVIAYLEDDVVHGAAELHLPNHASDMLPEIAFSVEAHLRHRGVGSVLFERLLREARGKRYTRLRVTTNSQNDAMRKLAVKFGAKLSYRRGEIDGVIDIKRLTLPDAAGNAMAMQADLARLTIGLNRSFWSNVLKIGGFGSGRGGSPL